MPYIAVAVVAVFAADVVLLGRLPDQPAERRPEAAAVRHRALAQRLPGPPKPVEPLSGLHRPNLFVVAREPLKPSVLRRVGEIAGIQALELADAAMVTIDGKQVQTLGVEPSSFRAFTPKAVAVSDGFWSKVAGGEVAVSYVLGNDGGLTLDRTVTGGGRDLKIGAYATMGMGTIDAVVNRETGQSLGLPQNNAFVLSAPKVASDTLRRTLLRVLPKGTSVAAINPVRPAEVADPRQWTTGSFMSAEQIATALAAATGKLGRPYVWGAEGPESFDCSGLVQWAFARAGVRVPRVTHQQWVSGPRIPLAEARPGDLIFWRHDPTNPGYISHVAIFLGDGKILQAPRTGDVVKISALTTRNLAGVVRVSPATAAKVR